MEKIVVSNNIITNRDLLKMQYPDGPVDIDDNWQNWSDFFLSVAITFAEGNLNQKGNVFMRWQGIYQQLKIYYIMESDKKNVIIGNR